MPHNYPHQNHIEKLASLGINYDYSDTKSQTPEHGWYVDHYEAELRKEAPGEPESDGSYAHTQDAIASYSFVDRKLIQGYWDPNSRLAERNILLRIKPFRWLPFIRFEFGGRVHTVIDERQGDEELWGWGYRTLEGHFEMGHIIFVVAKNTITGRVYFRMESVARLGHIQNIFYRIGAKLMARRLQKRFANHALRAIINNY